MLVICQKCYMLDYTSYMPDYASYMLDYLSLCQTMRVYASYMLDARLCEFMLDYVSLCQTMRVYASYMLVYARCQLYAILCQMLVICQFMLDASYMLVYPRCYFMLDYASYMLEQLYARICKNNIKYCKNVSLSLLLELKIISSLK